MLGTSRMGLDAGGTSGAQRAGTCNPVALWTRIHHAQGPFLRSDQLLAAPPPSPPHYCLPPQPLLFHPILLG